MKPPDRPYRKQLRLNGLAVITVGLLSAVVLALVEGTLVWMNMGLFVMAGGAVLLLASLMLELKARREE